MIASLWMCALLSASLEVATAQTPPHITGSVLDNGALNLAWTGNAALYEVQSTPTLAHPAWRPAAITPHLSVALPVSGGARYYRVVTPPTLPQDRSVDDQTRTRVIEAINEKIASMPGGNGTAESRELLAFLSGFQEFNDYGITEDSSVWARFSDGRLFLIINNRPPATDEERRAWAQFPSPNLAPLPQVALPGVSSPARPAPLNFPGKHATGPAALPTAIPVSTRAVLFKATLPDIDAPVLNYIAPAFRSRSYEVQGGEASLQNLRNVKNVGNDIGVFYIDSHGGIGTNRTVVINTNRNETIIYDEPVLAVASSTVRTEENDKLFQAELARGDLCYASLGPSVIKGLRRDPIPPAPPPPPPEVESFYCILPNFVRRNWKFGPNSLVYIDTCHGGSDGAVSFIQACIDSDAEVYLGWSKEVNDGGALQTTQVIFDVLLGGSQILPLDPPQRPFDRLALQTYLERSGFDTDPKWGAKLRFFRPEISSGDFGLLAPSILLMRMDEDKEELQIFGLFDPDAPVTVRIEGGGTKEIAATIKGATEIICPLPAGEQPSAGNVTVIQRGHKSNTVPLTEWWLKGTGHRYFTVGEPQPSSTIEFNLHFRADVHSLRNEPYYAPVFYGNSAMAARDSKVTVTDASGTYINSQGGSTTWSLSSPVELPAVYGGFAQVDIGFSGQAIFASDGSIDLLVIATAKNTMTVTSKSKNGEEVSIQSEPGTRTFPHGRSQLVPGTYSIQSGSTPAASDAGVFNWESAPAQFPPDRNAPGYAE